MNPETSKISDPHGLILNLTDKMNQNKTDKYIVSSNHSVYCTWKTIQKS